MGDAGFLLWTLVTGATAIGEGMETPEETWAPLVIVLEETGPQVYPICRGTDAPEAMEQVVQEILAQSRPRAVGFLAGCNLYSRRTGKTEEYLMAMAAEGGQTRTVSARVTRSRSHPPVLGEWEPIRAESSIELLLALATARAGGEEGGMSV